ncbi:MAG: hypothetical protein DRI90_05750 [Deltaproteobacteria bacterium]|nr:MAG: hypothetical protein DRI90_05750 [Deltaproteobacteria bacterium]
MIDTTTGEIKLDCGVRIPPLWMEDAFQSSLLASGAVSLVGNAEFHTFRAEPALISGSLFAIGLTFRAGLLCKLGLTLMHDDYGTSWDDWSEAKELQRKADHDAWLTSLLGGPPPHTFPWGKVTSSYDPKGGCSSILLSYL